jgi:hypothetical protein
LERTRKKPRAAQHDVLDVISSLPRRRLQTYSFDYTPMKQTPSDRSSPEEEILREVLDGVTKVRDNAEQLFSEAKILRAAGALSRALVLHQISMEECAKADMLGAWAISRLTGMPPEEKQFMPLNITLDIHWAHVG